MFGQLPFFSGRKGGNTHPALGDERGLLTQHAAPKHYHLAKHGMLFSGSSAATGLVLPIFSNTAQLFGVWNPAGSGVNVSLLSIAASYVDTTGAAGGFALAINKNIGSALATGGISAFTEATPDKGIVGMGAQGGSRVRFTASAATTIAPVLWKQLGINQLVLTATDATNGLLHFYREFDGDTNFGPGNAVWMCGNIATLSKWAVTWTWAEIPE